MNYTEKLIYKLCNENEKIGDDWFREKLLEYAKIDKVDLKKLKIKHHHSAFALNVIKIYLYFQRLPNRKEEEDWVEKHDYSFFCEECIPKYIEALELSEDLKFFDLCKLIDDKICDYFKLQRKYSLKYLLDLIRDDLYISLDTKDFFVEKFGNIR